MIDYATVLPGVTLRLVRKAGDFADAGDQVRVVMSNGKDWCFVERADGTPAYFVADAGAKMLEPA